VAEPLAQLQTALADRYRIEEELGRGGMGVVYRAWDVRHERPVALKVVRPELGSVLAAERFLREIQLAAKLQHPHIVPLYDSGEAAGALFYVMPLVEGESLRVRLTRERQLPLEDALQITHEIADALGYAHSHDVLHRDIKPENILLSGGHAAVVDFGIGRAITAAGGDRLTESGISVGTPAYMSPEQATGDAHLDGRSDLYSLACVLYEMLAGHPPFLGASAQEVIVRHTLDPVPSLRSARPGVPRAVERAVTKALAKVPADRFATAAALVAALEEARTAPAEPETAPVVPPGIRGRRWARIGLSAVAVVAGVMIASRLRSHTVYVPGRVVVAPFDNQTGDSALDNFTQQLATTLPDAIAREAVGEPVPAAAVRDLLGGAEGSPGQVAEWLARKTGAGLELRGTCSRALVGGTTCQVNVLRMPAKTLRMSVSVKGDPAQPAFAAELAERALVALLLQRDYGDRATWLGENLPRSLAAVRAFDQGNDLEMGGEGDKNAAQGQWEEAARLDTTWGLAAAWAAWTTVEDTAIARLQRFASRPGLLAGDRETVALILSLSQEASERTFELARRRFAVNPELWTHLAAWAAVRTGRAQTAVEIASYADSAVYARGEWLLDTYNSQGFALHELGRYEDELKLARALQRRFPSSSQVFANTHEAMALAALGSVDSLRRRLAEWEALTEPRGTGYRWAGTRAWVAGQELMAHGREQEGREMLQSTRPFYAGLRAAQGYASKEEINVLEWTDQLVDARRLALAALPRLRSVQDSVEVLAALGRISARAGNRAEAMRYDRLLAASRRSEPPRIARGAPFERATIAARLGDREGAVRLLEEAREKGEQDAKSWNVHRWPDFAGLRDYPPFQRFLKPRG
jgi:serine/threonine protein kinase/tetratricopeptide (TPR) repeat protein